MVGLAEALAEEGVRFKGSRVLILGSGGVAHTTAMQAAQDGASSIIVLSRNHENAMRCTGRVKNAFKRIYISAGMLVPGNLNNIAGNVDILINTTPRGMKGFEDDWEDFEFLDRMDEDAFVCDLIYDPPMTTLLKEAKKRQMRFQNGLALLRAQARLADELFFGL